MRLPRGRAYDPWVHANALHLTVIHDRIEAYDIEGNKIDGIYDDRANAITLESRLSDRFARCVLAHEVQHAIHRDPTTRDRRRYRKQEARADRQAAVMLVDDLELARAEQAVGMSAQLIADELGVLKSTIDDFRALARTTYLSPLRIDDVA